MTDFENLFCDVQNYLLLSKTPYFYKKHSFSRKKCDLIFKFKIHEKPLMSWCLFTTTEYIVAI